MDITEVAAPPAGWRVHQYDVERSWCALPDVVSGHASDLVTWIRARGGRHGQRFLLGPQGLPDLRVNGFLASARMRKLAATTNRDYAYSLALWLDFLDTSGCQWWEASEEDVEEFQFWRMTDPANDQRVEASSFARDLAACKTFYRFVERKYKTGNPFEGVAAPRGTRKADVKWLDPAAVVRWKDLGLRGMDLTGRRDASQSTRHHSTC